MRTRVVALAVVPLLVLPVACGSDDSGDTASSTSALEGVKITGDFGDEPKVTVKKLDVAKADSAVISEGEGPKASKDRQTLIDFTITNGTNGKQAYSSFDSGQLLPVGPSSPTIKGLPVALDGHARGSRIAFESKVSDAFGEQGATQIGLAPDDSMVLVADIVSVQSEKTLDGPDGKEVAPPAGAPKVVQKKGDVTGFGWKGTPAKPAQKLQVIPLVEGDGPAITAKRLVTFDYFGEVYRGKKPFDESYTKEPITFSVGAGGLIPAWDEGLIGVKEGSRVLIITPPDKAYGEAGSPPAIPANATLAFVIDVLGVDG